LVRRAAKALPSLPVLSAPVLPWIFCTSTLLVVLALALEFPIHAWRDSITEALRRHSSLIITGPTGCGKSTQVPQMLRDQGVVGDGKILVLQPRRLAARMLAQRIASERGSSVGGEVGVITRFETQYDAQRSRIVLITEGVLPRLFHDSPTLDGIGAVIFDEFHERALAADIGLGLAKRLQQTRRPDLKLVVMSATLESAQLGDWLHDAATVVAEGRLYPIEINYQQAQAQEPIWAQALRALSSVLRDTSEGDVLIFMPGAGEINRTIARGQQRFASLPVQWLPLYASLSGAAQDAVMRPSPQRKIIVATNIAETSLTIAGVRHVIDSGQARVSRYDSGRGVGMLMLEPISRFSAEQRAGRAGREAPGRCIRLWGLHEQSLRPRQLEPEIRRVDLSEAVLQIMALGFADPAAFPWLDAPDPRACATAVSMLASLGAIQNQNQLTALGRRLATLPMHPRLGRLLLLADDCGHVHELALIAAILSERDCVVAGADLGRLGQRLGDTLTPGDDQPHSDLFVLMHALDAARQGQYAPELCQSLGLQPTAARQLWRTYDYFKQLAQRYHLGRNCKGAHDGATVLCCLLQAFPDHIVRRISDGSTQAELPGGGRGELSRQTVVAKAELLLAAQTQQVHGSTGSVMRLSMLSELRRDWLEQLFPEQWQDTDELFWNDAGSRVEQLQRRRCLGLVISEKAVPVNRERAGELLAEQVVKGRLHLRGWDDATEAWIQRCRWLGSTFPQLALLSYDATDVACIIHEICAGERSYDDIRNKPCLAYVKNALSYQEQQQVERLAPEQLLLPSGRRMRIVYEPGQPPHGRARIQDLYGLEQTPRLADGQVPILLEILAPNMRPVQITDDLPRFWQTLYPEVKKQLARRYPRHEWR